MIINHTSASWTEVSSGTLALLLMGGLSWLILGERYKVQLVQEKKGNKKISSCTDTGSYQISLVVASTATEGDSALAEAVTGAKVIGICRSNCSTVFSAGFVLANVPTGLDDGTKSVEVGRAPESAGSSMLDAPTVITGAEALVEDGISIERTVELTDTAIVPTSFDVD